MHGGSGALGEDPVEGAEEVTVVATEMAFEPGALELVAGEPVNLTLVNGGEVEHDWDLDEAGAHLHAGPGEEVTQAVVVDEPGTYEAICTVPGHADAGMRMTVEVGPSGTSPAGGFDHGDLEDLDPDERREFFEELHG
jgi:uncharacterized cupredoxin-like copper-binding protein